MPNTEHSLQAFLKKKKIDEVGLKAGDPKVYAEWERLFPQMHEKSFSLQQLFRINPLRRKYPLREVE